MAGFVAVHSGAGNIVDESKYNRVIKEACACATEILKNGGSAMDACEAAIMRLENCEHTNAGFGSNLCWDGSVQCDASIMNGSNLNFGACTNVSTVKNPIQLARHICDGQSKLLSMERIPPLVLASKGAEQYASETGCEMIDPRLMVSSRAKFIFEHYKSRINLNSKQESLCDGMLTTEEVQCNSNNESALDTVGAVCIDSEGNTAAGCSSGGLLLKMPGRVGQAAMYGAGCFAMDCDLKRLATCTSGNGEYLMKTFLAKEICTDLLNSQCAVTSLHKTFKTKFLESPFLPVEKELFGGALTLVFDPKSNCGEVLWSHSTKIMCVGYMSTTQKVPKFIYSPLPTYSSPGKSVVVNGCNFHLNM